jgi:hypothetical protein
LNREVNSNVSLLEFFLLSFLSLKNTYIRKWSFLSISYWNDLVGINLSVDISFPILVLTSPISFGTYISPFFPLFEQHFLSFTALFSGASWSERECWDMLGIYFLLNLDMRRILTDYGFLGFPLKKSFPIIGFVELTFEEESTQVLYTPLSLSQEMRFGPIIYNV